MTLRVSQIVQFQLTLTPALRLSLDILQMPLMELETYLSQQMEENPVLEILEERPERLEIQENFQDRIIERLDDSMRDLWRQADGSPADSAGDEELPEREIAARPPSLHDHLMLQLRCLEAASADVRLAEQMLGWLDQDGYLRTPLAEIAESEHIDVAALERVLPLIHRLDPAGVGARNLQECLLIQFAHREESNSLAARIVRDHFELFAKRKIRQLATKTGVSVDAVQEACRTIAQLNPKPARNFSTEATPATNIPDLIVREVNGEFVVELNDQKLPRITLSSRYRTMLRNPAAPSDAKLFIRQRLKQAVWLLKAVHQRHETLLSIARALLDLERDYFVHGISHLKALTQERVAQVVGCHASTVSRAVAGKSMQTPHGVVPLSAFFGGGISQNDSHGKAGSSSGNLSPKTIQAEIHRLIDAEDPAKPLSDQVIEAHLKRLGYPVARRTVAKYRTALKLLPAHLRKRCF